MKASAILPILDEKQRYSISEASLLLRQSRAKIYLNIRAGKLATFVDGRRRYVNGAEIIRVSRGIVT